MEQAKMQLSIVVNMYNTASFLPRCMETLLNQDISPDSYEIILVDDGSTDNSLALAQEYATKSVFDTTMPTIRVEHHANKGLAGARNTGVDAAIGEYLCFVDPDDYIQENSLSALLHQMDEEQLDMLRFNYQKIDENGSVVPDSESEYTFDYSSHVMTGKEFLIKRLSTACYVWAYVYRLNIIKSNNIRFIEGLYFDDTPWLPRVLQYVNRINCTSVRHQYYLQRSGSLVHTRNLESIRRKLHGQISLIEVLLHQKGQCDFEIRIWYDSMLTHICVSLLTTVAMYDYKNRQNYLKLLKKILPLSSYNANKKTLRKIKVINICPRCFVWFVHIKTRNI
jgi:glycosyltransferase involved in cell wall biosynthesis